MARQPFNTRWAQGVESESSLNTFQAPSDVRVSTGWEGGQDKDAPPAGQENWWHNRADSALQDLERYGVMTWLVGAIYAGGAPVKGSDGNYYESLVSSNSGNNPVSTTGFWRLIGASLYSIVPASSLMFVASNGVPDTGWLKCNGALLARSSYPRLFDKIGTTYNTGGESVLQFRLPDARGEFLRVFDDARGADSGRTFGSFQAEQYASHTHRQTAYSDAQFAKTSTTTLYYAMTGGGSPETGGGNSNQITGPAGGNETRPRNLAFNLWIKY